MRILNIDRVKEEMEAQLSLDKKEIS